MTRKTPKPAMSVQDIAAVEGTTVSAISICISRALRKLRRERLLFTCRELAAELDRNRNRKEIVE